jgi:hypothetical protein
MVTMPNKQEPCLDRFVIYGAARYCQRVKGHRGEHGMTLHVSWPTHCGKLNEAYECVEKYGHAGDHDPRRIF